VAVATNAQCIDVGANFVAGVQQLLLFEVGQM
jgi:hypothetical protein